MGPDTVSFLLIRHIFSIFFSIKTGSTRLSFFSNMRIINSCCNFRECRIPSACLGSPCDQVPLDNPALLFLNGNLFNPLHTIGAGKKGSMINPLQKT